MKTYDNIITPSNYDNASMNIKKTYVELNSKLLTAMCKNIAYGQTATVAISKLAILSVMKRAFDGVTNTSMELSCGKNCSMQSKVVFGQTLEDTYGSWGCGSEICTGL